MCRKCSHGKRKRLIEKLPDAGVVGEMVRKRRLKPGLTQKRTADRAGIHLQQYQKFESGERNLANSSFRVAYSVLMTLELNTSEFIRKFSG